MQPYLFPYLGYFQLIHLADTFVVYDDVNFIKNGWINRNRILNQGKPLWLTLPLEKASVHQKISQTKVSYRPEKIYKTLSQSYRNAPYFNDCIDIIMAPLTTGEAKIANLCFDSLNIISNYLSLNTKIVRSSNLQSTHTLSGQDRVIAICNNLNTKTYLNGIGGEALYNKATFLEQGLRLNFLEHKPVAYPQFDHPFLSNLSIIDILMFNSKKDIQEMLESYQLI